MRPSAVRSTLLKLIPEKENVLLVGSPGVGKTDSVDAVAQQLEYDLLVMHPVVDDPTDYKGMPAVTKRKSGEPSAQFLPFGNLWRLIDAKKPLIAFMDDIGQAPQAVQAALMQLVLSRQINGHRVSDEVRFVAATNRRQDQAGVQGMITPLLDRFTTVLPFEFYLEDWIKWALDHELPVPLIAFARYRPDLIGKFEPSREMKKSPTPRSVAGLGRLINYGLLDLDVLAGAVGEGFATEYLAFHKTWTKIPDRNLIYLNPETVPVPEEMDVMYALMGSLAHGAATSNIEATVAYLGRCKPEHSVLCMKDIMHRKPELFHSPAFTRWVAAHDSVLSFD